MAGVPRTTWNETSPPTHPGTAPGSICGVMISGGMMSYRCALAQGHLDSSDDPEPHYTPEVHRTVTLWRDWAQREWERRQNPASYVQGEDLFVATAEGVSSSNEGGCPLDGCTIPMPHGHGTDTSSSDEEKFARLGDVKASGSVTRIHPTPTRLVDLPKEVEPTKQRRGDQVLPTGDASQVDDQSLLIQDIEARRQVGIQRYGQAHRPFNGRDTLLDAYEEQLDFLVYLRSLRRMAASTREDLIQEVERALLDDPDVSSQLGWSGEQVRMAAPIAVDRIMGWVTGASLTVP